MSIKKRNKIQDLFCWFFARLVFSFPRRFACLVCIASLLGSAACWDFSEPEKKGNGEDDNGFYYEFEMPQTTQRNVDILFQIDNSHSMAVHQERVKQNFPVLMDTLAHMSGGLPNVHIGVVTSDLGTGDHTDVRYCEEVGGDRGVLGKVGNLNLGAECIGQDRHYIIDVEPAGCQIDKTPDGHCLSHSCKPTNCGQVGHGLTLHEEQGCPRCRNYTGDLVDVFSCYADVGIHGCGFEQHLEAVRKALNVSETPQNAGFLRNESFLAVVVVADEDDCSAANPDMIFNPDPNLDNVNSELGFLHSFRCFEFGINCHVNDRNPGERLNCTHERTDANMLLHPIERYTSHLESLRDPMMTIVAAIAAPVPDVINVVADPSNRPELKPSCVPTGSSYGADPAVRIKAFAHHFNSLHDMSEWAFTSVCLDNNETATALESIASSIVRRMKNEICPTQPLTGCPQGPSGTTQSSCLPRCTIFDIEGKGLTGEQKMEVVWCGQVCEKGLCTEADVNPCNFDVHGFCHCPIGQSPTVFGEDNQVHCAPLLYPNGSPAGTLDPHLEALIPRQEPPCQGEDCIGRSSACWYAADNNYCPHKTEIRVVRAEEPQPRTFLSGRCSVVNEPEDL